MMVGRSVGIDCDYDDCGGSYAVLDGASRHCGEQSLTAEEEGRRVEGILGNTVTFVVGGEGEVSDTCIDAVGEHSTVVA